MGLGRQGLPILTPLLALACYCRSVLAQKQMVADFQPLVTSERRLLDSIRDLPVSTQVESNYALTVLQDGQCTSDDADRSANRASQGFQPRPADPRRLCRSAHIPPFGGDAEGRYPLGYIVQLTARPFHLAVMLWRLHLRCSPRHPVN